MNVQADRWKLVSSKERLTRRPALSIRAQRHLLRLGLLLCDAAMLALAFALAYWLRFELRVTVAPEIIPSPAFYGALALVLIPAWLALFALHGLYDFRNLLGGTSEYARVFDACTIGTMLVVVAAFLNPDLNVSRGWLVMAWVASFLLVSAARFWIRRLVYWLRRHGYFVVPALIIGDNEEAVALGQQLAGWTTSGLEVLGYVGDGTLPDRAAAKGLPVLGDLAALPELVERYQVEELIVASSALSGEHSLEVFRRYGTRRDINLRFSSGLFDVITTGLRVKSLGYVPLISADQLRLSAPERLLKACLDYAGAAIGLAVLSPLLAVIALAIKLDSPGPVIYRRRVLGCGGKVFDAYKFRSMHVDGDELLTPAQWAELQTDHKLKDDPRVTRVGRVIRKYSLDELPQLVNVLKGQMSLIGPRMITPAEKEKYGKWDMNLLTVKPGLSGLWQVSGRADVGYEERVRLDMHYIRNYTLWLDLQLILRTIGVVIKGKGAY